jgi:hypothetical protein
VPFDNYTLRYYKEIMNGSHIFYIMYRSNYYIKITCADPLMQIAYHGGHYYKSLIHLEYVRFHSNYSIVSQIQEAIRYLSSVLV